MTRYARAVVTPTARTRRVGLPWDRRTETLYRVTLEEDLAPVRLRQGPKAPPPIAHDWTVHTWHECDHDAELFARALVVAEHRRDDAERAEEARLEARRRVVEP